VVAKLLLFFSKIRVIESNGDVRILIENCETAVYAHAQFKFGQNSPERLSRGRAAFMLALQCIRNGYVF